jgi:SpoVK/Ycf46/Vps4 family AAA+-type ATPase
VLRLDNNVHTMTTIATTHATATATAALHEHEIPKYYQTRVLLYLFRNAASLKTRSNHAVPARTEVHEYFNLRTYNAVKSVIDEKTKDKEVPAADAAIDAYDPLNALFMSIGCGEYDYVFTDAKDEKHAFEIDYREEANPRPTSCDGMVFFRRLLVRTPTPASFVEFYKLASEIDNTSDEKLRISVTNKYSEWNTYSRIPVRRLNTVYMDERVKQRIMDDVTAFLNSEAEYDAFGIPYKKTYLLTGVPGSGKTSLIKALCNEIHYNLGIMSMSRDMDNATVQGSFRNIDPKTVLLLEDIDCLFEKRTSVETQSFTFSNLLNILDGVLFKHGLIVFITTNHPEKLDPALLRQGRTDLIVELNYPSRTEIEKLFRDMLGGKHYATAEATTTAFKTFYAAIKDKQLPMSAIVNFLFRHRDKHMDNLKELLDGDSFIKRVTGEETSTKLYA